MTKAYPVYDSRYQQALDVILNFMRRMPNLQLIGRNGMHRYNNQDHSMLTGMLAAKNVAGANYDLWKINADAEYHEEAAGHRGLIDELRQVSETQPLVPPGGERGLQ
jgi:hypothetical protein